MPTEIRIITFSTDEIREAIVDYCVKTGGLAPNVAVSALAFANDGEINVSLTPLPGGPTMIVKQSEIIAAVILHCKKLGVPIAQRSIKSLQVTKDVVSLHLNMPS